jgi:threonine synthase
MSFVRGLTCKECGTAYPVTPRMICDECFGPVEVSYDYAAMRGVVTRARIEAGCFAKSFVRLRVTPEHEIRLREIADDRWIVAALLRRAL